MHATRTRVVCAGLAVTAVLAGSLTPAVAKNSGTKSTKTTFRFVQDQNHATNLISGTYTVTGGIRDHGSSRGTIVPIIKKVRGQDQTVGIETTMTQHGDKGSFVTKCRDTHFVLAKDGSVKKASGSCVFSSPSGGYSRLAPVASTVIVPTHPRPGYTHTVRTVAAHTRAA